MGCLYFLTPANIASTAGLQAAAVLLLLLNMVYVLAMVILVAMTGVSKARRITSIAVIAVAKAASDVWALLSDSSKMKSLWALVKSPFLRKAHKSSADATVSTSIDGNVHYSGMQHNQYPKTGELPRGASVQVSVLPPAPDSSAVPWQCPEQNKTQDRMVS